MSVTLIAYPTADYTTDLQAWNAFNDRADADGAEPREDACFGCLFSTFATIYDQPELAYVLDTMGEIDIAITFSIDDINDITKRRGSFSKTIELPNTTTNASLFKFAYNVQSFVGGFQPNKKIRAAMWEDGVQVFSGAMQLLSMSKTKGEVTYEVGLFSEDVSLFQDIQNNLLVNTVGVSGMNHTLTSAHVSATWAALGASGYVYGLVDSYGATDVITQGWFAIPYWKMGPSIYVKKMVDLIFAQAGYRYTSNFFNSTLFKKLVIPYSAGTIPVNLSGSNIFAQSTGNVSGANNVDFTVLFSKDTPAPYFDNAGYWVASSSTFVAPNVPTRWNVSVEFTVQTVSPTVPSVRANMSVRNLTDSTDNAVITNITVRNNQKMTVVFEDVTIPANTTSNIGFVFTAPALGGAGTILSGSTVLWTCIDNPASIGVVDMRTALPADVKQSDLLVDLQKMFNLYFMPDAQDPKLLYIEPFKDFYSSGVVDWTQKVDENQEQLLTNGDPNQYKSLVFKYKDMGDYLSKTYKSSNPLAKEGYGGRQFLTQNFYGKSEFVCETMAGTLIPGSFTTDKVIGRAWDLEGSTASGTVKQLNTGYRLAQYNSIAQGTTSWFYQTGVSGSFATGEYVTNVPFVSHIDNPYAPTEDLAFGIPRQVFYNTVNASGTPITYTNNNLYNKYWLNYITETTSKEALQLELTMVLNCVDIYQLDFRKPIYYNGIRWRLLEIRDYTVGEAKPCRVTLRRILNLTEFVPVTSVPITSDPMGLPNGPIDPDPADPDYEPPVNPELPTPG
jgi:hypothetical protein